MPMSPDQRSARRPSTIRDVAALAGVSKSTASRALLGQAGVSPENLEKVQEAIEQLDFVPNRIARSLTASSPAILGLFIRGSASPFYAHLAEVFEEQAGRLGYEVVSVASGDRSDDAVYRSLALLADLRTAGIVVAAPTVAPRTIRQIASRVPLVLVGQMGQPDNPEVPFIAPDPAQGETLIRHVVELGHRSIALTAFRPEVAPTQWARVERMRDSLEAQGLLERLTIVEPEQKLTGLVSELHHAGVTALLCNNDLTALDALSAAQGLGLSVPGDLSIAGHDGISPFDHPAISLTTYRVPVVGMASAAADLVHRLVGSEPVREHGVLVDGELLVGRTTGPPATAR